MKKSVLTAVAVLSIGFTAFSQGGSSTNQFFIPALPPELRYEVRPAYTRPVTKEQLNEARFIRDVVSGYPENWINNHVSVEISATCGGKAVKARSPNEVLSPEQKKILNTADLATDIIVDVKYTYNESLTHTVENGAMHVLMTVVPETEAEYVGGYKQMYDYLKENGINKISVTTPKRFQKGRVRFNINEKGEVVHVRIADTSGDLKTDKLLLETILSMPKWKPAETSKGVKVMQEFEFSVGNGGC
jgi:hypothetical protein